LDHRKVSEKVKVISSFSPVEDRGSVLSGDLEKLADRRKEKRQQGIVKRSRLWIKEV
jgi:hypothetical protein